MKKNKKILIIALSFFCSFILAVVPFPAELNDYRPAIPAIVMIYWSLKGPQYIGVINGWFIGLGFDVLHGSVLGQNALGFTLIAYACLLYDSRFKFSPWSQQMVFVFILVTVYIAVTGKVSEIFASGLFTMTHFKGTLLTPLIWLLLVALLRRTESKENNLL
ncbi:MAG: rod shape-determining protein MreD [Proteobacteria bacterium]|nr:rod shape-determining protein MreD [Pseudomonadota bacterium]MBT5066258.1 rod shape-determining protein MreD [Pseudomonadota bacterium]MBT6192133.1 rod shape-determining protein MreD [Pseudomonadota bacterium]MBT6465842.1 rod shape-determining protein MreD [Pseudomonadota bacterium]MBT6674253.1 rod shape-determining protein MreD [Pseudomonadota bacterium]